VQLTALSEPATAVQLQVGEPDEGSELTPTVPEASTATQVPFCEQAIPASALLYPSWLETLQAGLVGVLEAITRPAWSTAAQNALELHETPVRWFVESIADAVFAQVAPPSLV